MRILENGDICHDYGEPVLCIRWTAVNAVTSSAAWTTCNINCAGCVVFNSYDYSPAIEWLCMPQKRTEKITEDLRK